MSFASEFQALLCDFLQFRYAGTGKETIMGTGVNGSCKGNASSN